MGSLSFVILNRGTAVPTKFSIKLSDIGLTNPLGYNVTEVFSDLSMGAFKPSDFLSVSVNPTGVFFGKALPFH